MLPKPNLTVCRLSLGLILSGALVRQAWSQTQPAVPPQVQRDINALRAHGQQAAGQKQFLQAEPFYLAALAKARAAHAERLTASLLNDLGDVNHDLQRMEKARNYHAQALAILEKQNRSDKREIIARAIVQGALGTDWHDLARSTNTTKHYELALYHLSRALSLFESQQDFRFFPAILQRLDHIHWSLGRFDKSVDYYRHALKLRTKSGKAEGIAISLQHLGDVYLALGRNDEALQSYSDALTQWNTLKQKASAAVCLIGIGQTHLSLSQFEEARAAFTQALHSSPSTMLSNTDKWNNANCYMGLGGVNAGLRKYEEAQDNYRRALPLFQQLHDPVSTALCYQSLVLLQQQDGAVPVAALTGTSGSMQVPADAMGKALNLLSQGSAHIVQGHTQTAVLDLERALPLLQRLHASPYLAACWNLLAEAYARQGQFAQAQTAYQRAVDSYEAFSEQVGNPGQLGLLQESGPNLHAHYARLLVQQKQTVRALLIVERGRAQGLARQAAQNRVEYNASILSKPETAELRRREDTLRSASQSYFVRHLPGAQARYEQAKLQRDLLNTALYKRHAAYKRLRGAEPPTFARLQDLARQHPDTLYLEWAVVDEKTSLLFALSHAHDLQAFALPYGSKTLFALTHEWRASLNATALLLDRHTPFDKQNALWKLQASEPQAAAKLYALLFPPIERAGLLSHARRLVFVADGPLRNAPFAALLDTHGKRLIERYALSSAISLGTLLWPPNPRRPQRSLLCLADATGDTMGQGYAATVGAASSPSPHYGALPFARKYGTAIAASVPGSLLYPGQKAQKAMILPQLPLAAVLLFATHGALNANNGLRSALILASSLPGKQAYDTLEAREIVGLQLSARLAILAACESGLGQEGGGEGLLGLAWAFRAAGCPCVTASQWSVDEEATSLLMKYFWDGLRAHKRKDDALRDAMLRVQRDPKHPAHARAFYWAAFQVIGDTAPISIGNIPNRH